MWVKCIYCDLREHLAPLREDLDRVLNFLDGVLGWGMQVAHAES